MHNKVLKIVNNRKAILDELKSENLGITEYVKDKIRVLGRIFNPTGISIAFLGPDGSGKTTIINGLLSSQLPFRNNNYFHLKPLRVKESANSITANPHKYKPYNKVKSYAKLLYFFFQYNLGWIKNIIPLKIKSTLIIFDRYFDDLLADQKRYRYGGKNAVVKFFRSFIKKPSLYFVLVADPEIIYKRKQEVSFKELENQVLKYRSLADNKRYFEIAVNNEPEKIVEKIRAILMKKMNERY